MLATSGLPSISSPCGLAWLPLSARAMSKVVDFIPSGSKIFFCHRFVIGFTSFHIGIDEMGPDVSCGRRDQIAVLKYFSILAGGLHGSEQCERRQWRSLLEFEDPLQIL